MTVAAARPRVSRRSVAHRALTVVPGISESDEAAVVRMALQPVVDLSSRTVVGYEALARFGASGSRLPGSVFSEAKRQGRETELEALLLERALGCRVSVPEDQWLAVNISQPAALSPLVEKVLQDHALGGVVLEITEQSLAADPRSLVRRLDDYRNAGALIALDDVGSGHSGLRQLLEIQPDIVKLDRSLVAGVAEDDARQMMVASMLNLCDGMGSVLLAEGVEAADDLACLAALGVVWVQGFLLGRPSLRRHDLAPTAREALDAVCLPMQPRAPRVPTAVEVFTTRFGAALALTGHHLAGAVVLDGTGFAVELLLPCPEGGVPASFRPTLASAGTPPRELLTLALDRAAADRSAPLVLTGTDGLPCRLLPVSQLIEQLLS